MGETRDPGSGDAADGDIRRRGEGGSANPRPRLHLGQRDLNLALRDALLAQFALQCEAAAWAKRAAVLHPVAGEGQIAHMGGFRTVTAPHTGRSPTELASVSICAPTAMQADALSTATFVMGVERGMKLLSETPSVDALMVLKNGKTFVTKNFPVDA